MPLLTVLGLSPSRRMVAEKAGAGLPDVDKLTRAAGDDDVAVGTPPKAPPTTAPTGGTPPKAPTLPSGVPVVDPALQAGGSGGDDKDTNSFKIARATVQRLLDDLNGHPQKTRIQASIDAIVLKLGQADTFAGAKNWTDAQKALAEAKTQCTAAKKLAQDWVDYLKKREDAQAIAYSFGSADFDADAWVKPKLIAADNLAKGPPANFPGALAAIKAIPDALKPQLQSTIDKSKAKLAAIDKTSKEARAFAKAQIDPGRQHLAAAEKHFAAGEWSLCLQRAAAAMRFLGPADRICERRDKYDKQRVATMALVEKVRAVPALRARAQAIDQIVFKADKLAAIEVLKIEDGVATLESASAQATMWDALGPTILEHARERAAADRELGELDTHPAAEKVKAQREAARTLLAGAKNATVVADGMPDPTSTWNTILTDVKRARADLAAAKVVADGLKAAAGAEAAAAKPGNKAGLKSALEKLEAEGKLAEAAPHADQAKDQFKLYNDEVKVANDALTKNDGAAAAKAMTAAAAALTAARTVQSGHAQFLAALPDLELQLKTIKASPRAPNIKPRIDPLEAAVTAAKEADKKHDGAAALAAVRKGSDAVAAAKAADKSREDYDKRVTALTGQITAVGDATEKNALNGLAANAKGRADALDFAEADKIQNQIEVRLAKAEIAGLAGAGVPDAAKITAAAKKMVDKGDPKALDDLIAAIPDGGKIEVLNALAEGRYGVKFSNSAALAGGDPVKTMRMVCGMFAKMPQDIVNSPSVAGVEWKDAIGSAGGSHSYDDVKIRMNGRPVIKQKFGAAQTNKDPKTGNFVKQLPPAIDPDCQPKTDTEVEYIAFAAAHEVGHAVDDARGFMARNGHQEKFGGWTTYGGNVQPIADAVGADPRYAAFYKTAEQKRYVLDRLLNKPATAPAAKPGAEASALAAFDTWISIAISANVYRRQGDCDAIQIGDKIYHQAYTRVWVSYLAAARKKALTGYQFRAPGEWFAELYAGFRSDKLQDTHPAMEWLKKL